MDVKLIAFRVDKEGFRRSEDAAFLQDFSNASSITFSTMTTTHYTLLEDWCEQIREQGI